MSCYSNLHLFTHHCSRVKKFNEIICDTYALKSPLFWLFDPWILSLPWILATWKAIATTQDLDVTCLLMELAFFSFSRAYNTWEKMISPEKIYLVMFPNQFHYARSCVASDLTSSWTSRKFVLHLPSWLFFQAFLLSLFLFSVFPLFAFLLSLFLFPVFPLFAFLSRFWFLLCVLLLLFQPFPPQTLPFLFSVLWFLVRLLLFFALFGVFPFTASEIKK